MCRKFVAAIVENVGKVIFGILCDKVGWGKGGGLTKHEDACLTIAQVS